MNRSRNAIVIMKIVCIAKVLIGQTYAKTEKNTTPSEHLKNNKKTNKSETKSIVLTYIISDFPFKKEFIWCRLDDFNVI